MKMAILSSFNNLTRKDSSDGENMLNNRTILFGSLILALGAMIWMFWHGVSGFFEAWSREEYSHGPVIPFIAVFLIARQLSTTEPADPKGIWLGVLISIFGIFLGGIGTLSNIADVTQYGLIITFVGILVSLFGRSGTLMLWAPIIYLVFMIPLPQILYLKLFSWAQLISSAYGTFIVRFFGIPVFLEGNIIDLGTYKLQVVEACSGLRYLFPLMSFGYLFAVVYQGAKWERVALFLSTIPISILMNSFRIGVIGVLVHNFGIEQAEGFLHFSEGWVVFVACLAILYAEATLFSMVFHRNETGPKRTSLDLGFDRLGQALPVLARITNAKPLMAIAALLFVGIAIVTVMKNQTSQISERDTFSTFPTVIGPWKGRTSTLTTEIERVLGADDYLASTFISKESEHPVNVFIAYYASQNGGSAVHSPEVCIPGAGWEISSLVTKTLSLVGPDGGNLEVKRAIIQKSTRRELVYYWFQERDRTLTSEWAAKWYVFFDSLTRNRTDGSIIRLITPIREGEGEAASDERLQSFLKLATPKMASYLPK